MIWAIVSGEYPPVPGGVADYSARLADALAQRGDEVHVWTSTRSPASANGRVSVRPLPDNFSPGGCRWMADKILQLPAGRTRVLVQYVPHSFFMKTMNVALCTALRVLSERFPIDLMFHEVAMPINRRQPLLWSVAGVVQRGMARMLVASADRVFASTSAWAPLLGTRTRALPVPSNVDRCDDANAIATLRRCVGVPDPAAPLVGHFGGCHSSIEPAIQKCAEVVRRRHPGVKLMFIGGPSSRSGERIRRAMNDSDELIVTTGPLPANELGLYIAACDLLVLPYPDGVTTRRSSVMAALSAGRAVVTTSGRLTERLWRDTGSVVLVPVESLERDIGPVVADLLADAARRTRVAEDGRVLYERTFDLSHTVAALSSPC